MAILAMWLALVNGMWGTWEWASFGQGFECSCPCCFCFCHHRRGSSISQAVIDLGRMRDNGADLAPTQSLEPRLAQLDLRQPTPIWSTDLWARTILHDWLNCHGYCFMHFSFEEDCWQYCWGIDELIWQVITIWFENCREVRGTWCSGLGKVCRQECFTNLCMLFTIWTLFGFPLRRPESSWCM